MPAGRVPFHVNGDWSFVSINNECGLFETLVLNANRFPVGRFLSRLRWLRISEIVYENADQIFDSANKLVREAGAELLVVFLVSPDECLAGMHEVRIRGLRTPHVRMMDFCPEDEPALKSFRFPTDGHWSPEGNAWAARVLSEIVRAKL